MTENLTEKTDGDAVLREVRRIKETLGAEYGHDIEKLFDLTAAHEKRSAHPVAEKQASNLKARS